MGKISLGATDIKKLGLAASDIKKISLGTLLVWQSGIGEVLVDYKFDYVAANLSTYDPLWVDRAYSSAIWAVDADGVYATTSGTTYRDGNMYYYNQEMPNQDQWATVEVVLPPASETNGRVGVTLRSDTNNALFLSIGTTTAKITKGASNSTSANTVLATYNLPTPLVAGDVVGLLATGTEENTTCTIYINEVAVAVFPGLVTYESQYLGIHISNGQVPKLKNFKAGVLDSTKKYLGIGRSTTFVLAAANAWEKVTGWTGGANTVLVNDEIVVQRTGSYKITQGCSWATSSGNQLMRVIRNGVETLVERTSGGGTATVTAVVNLTAGDSLRYEAFASNASWKTLSAAATYISIIPL